MIVHAAFRSITMVWMLLLAVTLLSWILGSEAHAYHGIAITLTVLVIAFFKMRMILFHFMEVRCAPLVLRIVCDVWLIVVCSALIAVAQIPKGMSVSIAAPSSGLSVSMCLIPRKLHHRILNRFAFAIMELRSTWAMPAGLPSCVYLSAPCKAAERFVSSDSQMARTVP